MQQKPDIVLGGRLNGAGEERFLYLYSYLVDDEKAIFSYRFSDWEEDWNGYYILYRGRVYFDRDSIPSVWPDQEVTNRYRPGLWSGDEIKRAIEDYLVSSLLLG